MNSTPSVEELEQYAKPVNQLPTHPSRGPSARTGTDQHEQHQ